MFLGVNYGCLKAADDLLKKVHRRKQKLGIPCISAPPDDDSRSEKICRSLCSGFYLNAAIANNTSSISGGFALVEGFTSLPVNDVSVHPSSTVPKEHSVKTVIFMTENVNKKGKIAISQMTRVEDEWLRETTTDGDLWTS